jgi:gliding motility-associated-like protein
MKKLLFCLLTLIPFIGFGQCDVDLLGYDPITHQVSIAIINGENCGCNEATQIDGNTCNPNGSSSTSNNESITHLVFGLHYDSFEYDTPCAESTPYHPNWTYTLAGGSGWEYFTGDTANFTLNTPFGWDCILDNPQEDICWEFVVWQINISQTVDIVDFPEQYWTDTCGVCADQTQMYPDIDLSNNSLVWCPDELPPPPLYPGCTDEEADNFDINATFDDGSCEYPPVLGCNNPTACNYNSNATVDDGSCIVCNTPNGEELCNAYQNDDSYWDWYVNLFNCPTTGDIAMDTLIIVEADCDVFNLGVGCNEGIRFHTTYTNTGLDSIYTWKITWTGPNGFISASNQGVDGGVPPYNIPLPPSITAPTINTITTQMLWQEGDTLCATASLVGQIELTPEDNTICTTLPAYPVCISDCTDPLALNYNMTTECTDNSLCEYLPVVDVGLDTILYETGCNELGAYWLPTFYLTNYGEVPITELCVTEDILSSLPGNDTVCFNNFTILPGETYELEWPYEYEWGVLTVRIIDVNGESEQSWNSFGLDNNVGNNMYVQIITDEPDCVLGCIDPEANNYNPNANVDDGSCEYDITELTYVGAECYVDCDLSGPFYYVNTTWTNTGTLEITNFCAEWDVIGGDGDIQECWNGNLALGDTVDLLFGPYTSEQGLLAWAYLQVLNGITLDPQIENYETLYCWGSAEASCIYGCVDEIANNYDSNADLDDGSCEYDIEGCTIEQACNYNPEATVNDGSCDFESCVGCMDPEASNYDPEATINNSSLCVYDIFGCTDETAFNYNPFATVDDGSCIPVIVGCMIPVALNYNPDANTTCVPIEECCIFPIEGCTDSEATNYNPEANLDDGSCEYIEGCTDENASNYDSDAIIDDGSCYYLPEPCDGSYYVPNTFTPNNDGVNDGWAVVVANSDCWRIWYVAIYNRWGGLVWESSTIGEVWPASVFNGNHYVADGVYVYLVRGEGWNPDHTFQTTGHITIFR